MLQDLNAPNAKLVRTLGVALALATGAIATSAEAQNFAFNANVSGWLVYNISYIGEPLNNPEAVASPAFDPRNGLPSGSLRVADLTSETWIGATTAVAGDKSSLFGTSSVSFDVLYRFTDRDTYAAIALYGGGLTVYQAHEPPELDVWLHWDYPLVVGSWHVGSIFGPLATESDMLVVLGDLQGVFIHTEWKTGPDDTNVDNITFGACVNGGGPGCCPADLDQSGAVGAADLAILLGAWGGGGSADLDGSGSVGPADLAILLGAWGPCN